MTPRFLVIDDDDVTRLLVETHLKNLDYEVSVGGSASDLRALLEKTEYCAIFLDINLPDGNGIELLPEIQVLVPDTPVIMITGDNRVESVVGAMQAGAMDYCPKPLELPRLKVAAKNAVERYALRQKVTDLERTQRSRLDDLIGISPAMQVIYHIIETVAPTKAPVLITGESGCGKELVARALHNLSLRRERELIDVNCAAIPKDLLESELFGHERSAFTGATKRSIGRCERAHQSTLFLDEIGEMDINLQAKMLRFLQDHTFYRVGGQEKVTVDTRIVSATNRDPQEAISVGQLREDLFYRLNVVNIHIPPLRERPDDIPILAQHFLKKYTFELGKRFVTFSESVLVAFESYNWPGNVRELENCIHQIVVLYDGTEVEMSMMPLTLHADRDFSKRVARDESVSSPSESKPAGAEESPIPMDQIIPLVDIEKMAIGQALKITQGNVGQAAVGLQMSQATLYRKIREYNLNLKDYK